MIKSARFIVLHRSLVRPLLLSGGERRLVLLNLTLIAMLLLGIGLHLITIILAILCATLGQWCIRQAAKTDYLMSQVYLRHIRYASYYRAQANVVMKPKASPCIPEKFSIAQ